MKKNEVSKSLIADVFFVILGVVISFFSTLLDGQRSVILANIGSASTLIGLAVGMPYLVKRHSTVSIIATFIAVAAVLFFVVTSIISA